MNNDQSTSTITVRFLLQAVLLLTLAACSREKNEFAPPPPAPVTVANPDTREVVVPKTFPATLTGVDEVAIHARVTGILQETYFTEGKKVKKGDKLFLIDPAPYVAANDAAKADLKNAEASHELAKAKLARLEKVTSGAVSEIDVEIARAEVDQAAAVVSQRQATLENTGIDLSYTEIYAPTNGRMGRALVDVGNLVQGSQATLLANITDDSEIRAYFEVPERGMLKFLAERAEEGTPTDLNPVSLELADGTVYPEKGTIDFVDSRIDPSTRTATVRAVFPNPDGILASGLYGLVGYPQTFPNKEFPATTLVPAVSVLRDLAGDYVWVVDDQNIVRRRGIETGNTIPHPADDPDAIPSRDMVVLRGLSKSDRVIVDGLQRAREGATVAPQFANKGKTPPSDSSEN